MAQTVRFWKLWNLQEPSFHGILMRVARMTLGELDLQKDAELLEQVHRGELKVIIGVDLQRSAAEVALVRVDLLPLELPEPTEPAQ